MTIDIRPATPDSWSDLERVFGPNGRSGCWCQWFKQTTAEFEADHGPANREALRSQIAGSGIPPGLIAYVDGEPAGWVAVEPRLAYPKLNRSPVAKSLDDREAWAVTCFVVRRQHRRIGVAQRLLEAAAAWAKAHGAEVVEGYPIDPGDDRVASSDAYHGVVSMFERAGFTEAARRTPRRPLMRLE